MFESLVWRRALSGLYPYTADTKLDYNRKEDFYPCEVLEVAGNYILVAPLFFAPIWVLSNVVQITEETYYELIKEKDSDTTT